MTWAKKGSPGNARGACVLDLCEGNMSGELVKGIAHAKSQCKEHSSYGELAVSTVMSLFRNSNFRIKSNYRIDLIIPQTQQAQCDFMA